MRKLYVLFFLAGAILISSCRSVKSDLYLMNVQEGVDYPYEYHEPTVHQDDQLSITVSSRSPELAVPFNSNGGIFQIDANGSVTESATQTKRTSYRVDKEGNIDFPILGKLHIAGMTINEVQDMIKQRIMDGKYIKDPLVTMEFLNFRYTILGEVGSTGTKSVNDAKINLLQAIADAGDLTARANPKRVLVYRENNGVRRMYAHNIQDKEIFSSPCFYLQQNDVVYVEPRYHKKDSEDKVTGIASLVLSFVTAIASIIWITKR